MSDTLTELFGEPISVYTRAQALEDGMLVDVTEWGSRDKGFLGGFNCPVVMTRALWVVVDIDNAKRARSRRSSLQSTRGRAHDVLWMASLACRRLLGQHENSGNFVMILTHGRQRNVILRVVMDNDGVTVGFPDDF